MRKSRGRPTESAKFTEKCKNSWYDWLKKIHRGKFELLATVLRWYIESNQDSSPNFNFLNIFYKAFSAIFYFFPSYIFFGFSNETLWYPGKKVFKRVLPFSAHSTANLQFATFSRFFKKSSLFSKQTTFTKPYFSMYSREMVLFHSHSMANSL